VEYLESVKQTNICTKGELLPTGNRANQRGGHHFQESFPRVVVGLVLAATCIWLALVAFRTAVYHCFLVTVIFFYLNEGRTPAIFFKKKSTLILLFSTSLLTGDHAIQQIECTLQIVELYTALRILDKAPGLSS
jgi:hypothetical protein